MLLEYYLNQVVQSPDFDQRHYQKKMLEFENSQQAYDSRVNRCLVTYDKIVSSIGQNKLTKKRELKMLAKQRVESAHWSVSLNADPTSERSEMG